MEKQCVLFDVWIRFLNVIQISLRSEVLNQLESIVKPHNTKYAVSFSQAALGFSPRASAGPATPRR